MRASSAVPARPGHASAEIVGLSFEALARTLDDPLLLLDADGRIVHSNPATARVFGHGSDSLVGWSARLLLSDSLPERRLLRLLRRLRRVSDGAHRFEILGRHADGHEIPLEACLARIEGGERPLFSCLIRDVTAAKAVERGLRASQERLALALRGAHDAYFDWDLVSNCMHLSPRWREMVGLAAGAPSDDPDTWLSRVAPEDRDRLHEELSAHLEGRTRHFHSEHRVLHADGGTRWILARGLAVLDTAGRPVRIAGSLSDITDRVKLHERLRREAMHDPLTGLPNRAYIFHQLRLSIARARQGGDRATIAYIDLDGFKKVNDELGHHAGDELLIAFAQRLRSRLGGEDVAARLGGDEFLVLVEGGIEQAESLACALQADLREPLSLSTGDRPRTSASIGIASLTDEHRRAEDLVADADAALYRAKAEGKARHAVFEPELRARARGLGQRDGGRRAEGPTALPAARWAPNQGAGD